MRIINNFPVNSKILITGMAGSAARLLARHIHEYNKHVEIFGIVRVTPKSEDRIPYVTYLESDLTESIALVQLFSKNSFDYIFHFASNASVRQSFLNPLSTMQNNISLTLNLFETIKVLEVFPKIVISSTSEVYGNTQGNLSINENSALSPVSPYAVSKTTQDLLANYYYHVHKMRIVRIRMFSYVNPLRVELFATSWADQIAKIEAGKLLILKHGNLEPERSLLDYSDAMQAYVLAALNCEDGDVYNVGRETRTPIFKILETLISLSNFDIKTELDLDLIRPSDIYAQLPDASKFRTTTGWVPKVTELESLTNLLNYRRSLH